MDHLLANYYQLLARVDALCHGILEVLSDRITCSEGCSDCCTAITLFPVEAAALRAALDTLPDDRRRAVLRHVAEHAGDDRCPLLEHHRCLLYAARPVICRTHGLPIIYGEEDPRTIDCCPLNTVEEETVPGSAVIDLDRLNTLLVAINALYLSQAELGDLPERLTIAEALKVSA